MQELIGMKIGPYQIQRHLARGGMANVYLACNIEDEAEPSVAVKLVHTSVGDYCERFCREARAHYTLHHDHILPALAYGELDSWWYLITPYIAGGTLSNFLKHGPVSIENATKVFSQLASALHYAHERGIIHRDIKASNVLMRDEQYAYLADFGLVKHVGLDASLTASGYIIGTPEYMAPELAEEGATPRSDIYALGVLLYQMLTGQVPFRGNSPFTLYIKHLQEHPVNPAVLNSAVPPEVGRVVLQALAKDPDDRYQTAQDFNIAYQQALAQASARQAKGIAMVCDATLPVPQVRLVKKGNLCHPDGLQVQKAISTGRRKTQRGVVVPMVALVLLMLSLLSASGTDARWPSLPGLVTQAITNITHANVNPTPAPSPTPPMAPIPQPIAMPQQITGHTSNNGNSNSRNGHGNRGKQDNGNSSGQYGSGNEQGNSTSRNGPGNRDRQGDGNNGNSSGQHDAGNGQVGDSSGDGSGHGDGGNQGNGNNRISSGQYSGGNGQGNGSGGDSSGHGHGGKHGND